VTKKRIKIVIEFKKSIISALVSNAGEFEDCAGFDQELFKRTNNEDLKFYFTTGTLKDIYLGILRALENNIKYPNKTSSEYNSLKSAKGIVESEYKRQTGEKINL